MTEPFPQPEITPLSEPYWQALREGRLMFQRCGSCGNAWLPPRSECPRCLRASWAWEQAGGRGRMVSWVVYHVGFHEAFRERLPYNVAIVELVEGPRLVTNIVDLEADGGPAIDRSVELVIEEEHGTAIARFRYR